MRSLILLEQGSHYIVMLHDRRFPLTSITKCRRGVQKGHIAVTIDLDKVGYGWLSLGDIDVLILVAVPDVAKIVWFSVAAELLQDRLGVGVFLDVGVIVPAPFVVLKVMNPYPVMARRKVTSMANHCL
jgi:hypothetical protein